MPPRARFSDAARFGMFAPGVKRLPTNATVIVTVLTSLPWRAHREKKPVFESKPKMRIWHFGRGLAFQENRWFQKSASAGTADGPKVHPIILRHSGQQVKSLTAF